MCELTLAVSHPPGEEQVVQVEPQRGVRFDLDGVSQLTFWRHGWILSCLPCLPCIHLGSYVIALCGFGLIFPYIHVPIILLCYLCS